MVKPKQTDIDKFDESEIGKTKNTYLKRAKVTGILAIMFGLVYLILSIYYKQKWYDIVTSIILVLFGIYFIFNSIRLKYQEVNKFMHNRK